MVYVFANNDKLKICWGSRVEAPSAPARWESLFYRAFAKKHAK